MKGHQKTIAFIVISAFIVWGTMIVVMLTGKSDYSLEQEARYIGENVIKNSEGTIYEYEYEFELEDSKIIYYHSHKKMEFNSKEMILYKEGENNHFMLESQFKEHIENTKKAEKISRMVLLISVVILVIEFWVEEKIVKKIAQKRN